MLSKDVLMNHRLTFALLPYILPQPEDTSYAGMVHRWGTLWVQGTSSQGTEHVGMAGILPSASDTWSNPKSQDFA